MSVPRTQKRPKANPMYASYIGEVCQRCGHKYVSVEDLWKRQPQVVQGESPTGALAIVCKACIGEHHTPPVAEAICAICKERFLPGEDVSYHMSSGILHHQRCEGEQA